MAEIRLVKYEPALEETWDSFIDNSINGTLFHKQRFMRYHAEGKFNDASLLFYEANRLLAVFPAAIVTTTDGEKVLKSHPGTSYGGLVFDAPLPLEDVFSILKCLHEYAKQEQAVRIEFRQGPKIFNRLLIDQFDFALAHFEYERKEQELATFFSLEHFSFSENFEEFLMQFPQKNRNEIRKGLKEELIFRPITAVSELQTFHAILSKSLEMRFQKKPTHTFEEFQKILQLCPGQCFTMGIFKGDVLTAGFFVMQMNTRGWHIFYAPMNYEYQNLRPLNFGVAQLIHFAMKKGMKVLNYGISTEQGGKHINWQLYKFKENFNGTGAIRTYWVKQLQQP